MPFILSFPSLFPSSFSSGPRHIIECPYMLGVRQWTRDTRKGGSQPAGANEGEVLGSSQQDAGTLSGSPCSLWTRLSVWQETGRAGQETHRALCSPPKTYFCTFFLCFQASGEGPFPGASTGPSLPFKPSCSLSYFFLCKTSCTSAEFIIPLDCRPLETETSHPLPELCYHLWHRALPGMFPNVG